MNFYPSSNVSKRFEETRPNYSWQDVPSEVKPDLSDSIQYAINKRRTKIRAMYIESAAVVGALLTCRFVPESVPVVPTTSNVFTISAMATVALLGIVDKVRIINGENEYISEQYDALLSECLARPEEQ